MIRQGMADEQKAPGTGIRFTNGKDATEVVIPQYREAFMRLISADSPFSLYACEWTDVHAAQLATSLVYAHRNGYTTQSKELVLTNNELLSLIHI